MAETATTQKYLKMLREHLDQFPGSQPTDVAVMAYGLGMLEVAAAEGDIDKVRATLAAISEARKW